MHVCLLQRSRRFPLEMVIIWQISILTVQEAQEWRIYIATRILTIRTIILQAFKCLTLANHRKCVNSVSASEPNPNPREGRGIHVHVVMYRPRIERSFQLITSDYSAFIATLEESALLLQGIQWQQAYCALRLIPLEIDQ